LNNILLSASSVNLVMRIGGQSANQWPFRPDPEQKLLLKFRITILSTLNQWSASGYTLNNGEN